MVEMQKDTAGRNTLGMSSNFMKGLLTDRRVKTRDGITMIPNTGLLTTKNTNSILNLADDDDEIVTKSSPSIVYSPDDLMSFSSSTDEDLPEIDEIKDDVSEIKYIVPEIIKQQIIKQQIINEVVEIKQVVPEIIKQQIIKDDVEIKQVVPEIIKQQIIKDDVPEIEHVVPEIINEVVEIKRIVPEIINEVVEIKRVVPEVVEIKRVVPEVVEIKRVVPEVVEIKRIVPEIINEVVEIKRVVPEVVETKRVVPEVVETKRVVPEVVETKRVVPEVVETIKYDLPKTIEHKFVKQEMKQQKENDDIPSDGDFPETEEESEEEVPVKKVQKRTFKKPQRKISSVSQDDDLPEIEEEQEEVPVKKRRFRAPPRRRTTKKSIPKQQQQKKIISNIPVSSDIPDYASMSKEDQLEYRSYFKVVLSKLQRQLPDWEVVKIDNNMSLEEVHSYYVNYKRQIEISRGVDQYKIYLIVASMIIEVICTNMGLPMTGYTNYQIKNMRRYEMLLDEMGENSFQEGSIFGQNWSPEIRIIGISLVHAAAFIIINLIAKYFGGMNITSQAEQFVSYITGDPNQPMSNSVSSENDDEDLQPIDGSSNGLSGMISSLAPMITSFLSNSTKKQEPVAKKSTERKTPSYRPETAGPAFDA